MINIRTDNKWRDFKYGYEVPPRVLKDKFDYLEDGEDTDGFFKRKNEWYHTSEFLSTHGYDDELAGWDGIANWSFSNGLLIKISNDGERYKVAYYWTTSE